MKKIFTARVDALFPELPGAVCNQTGRGEGSSARIAVTKAVTNLMTTPRLKRRKFSTFNATFAVGFRLEE